MVDDFIWIWTDCMIFSFLLSQRGARSRFMMALVVVALIWIGFFALTGWGQG
ncbi:MAG: hypothetical protein P8R39_02790 [Alphaproteobacteria bacterium]|jgi:hypothetical protein|nr:hypothetical protein [Alphaproteobacteria bacterium]